jgi:hypothetical protein
MDRQRDAVRIPLQSLRRQVADAAGVAASLVDVETVSVDGNALEVEYSYPDADVPIVDVVVEHSDGRRDSTTVELQRPAGLNVYGETLRVEFVGRDSETGDVLVSVDRRAGDDWVTVLGCGREWTVEPDSGDDPARISCYARTPRRPSQDE